MRTDRMTKKAIIIFFIIILRLTTLNGQTVSTDFNKTNESFSLLSDSLIKKEVAFFTIKGASFKKADTHLSEVPIRQCSDKTVYLNIFPGKINTYVTFYLKGETSDRRLDSIFLVFHSHLWVKIPKSSFEGLSQPPSCNFSGGDKKAQFFSPYYKAFYVPKANRFYIYMQGETDSQKYEVTWVIVGDKFLTRIYDLIP